MAVLRPEGFQQLVQEYMQRWNSVAEKRFIKPFFKNDKPV